MSQMSKHKLELLAPAGSMESLRAAVAAGADAVYFGGSGFNARHSAQNFTEQQMREAVALCHRQGVRCYITVNTLVSDRELSGMRPYIESLCALGVDALIVQDLGLMRHIRSWAPGMPVIASTQAAANSLPALQALASLGFTRSVVGRELSGAELKALCAASPIEVEAFGHGALCYAVSGQCYLSAFVGRRSANRGRCAGPCRLPYSLEGGKSRHMLSLKDSCLVTKLQELQGMGVGSLKIEGRMKRPEYVSSVTTLYREALDSGRPPKARDIERVGEIFSRSGFTSGYYDGQLGADMFGMRDDVVPQKYQAALAHEQAFLDSWVEPEDAAKTPVSFTFLLRADRPASLTAATAQDAVTVEGDIPQQAERRATSQEDVVRALSKTGGTGFEAAEISCTIEQGLMLPQSALNALRRAALEALPQPGGRPPVPCDGPSPALSPSVPPQPLRLFGLFAHVGQVPEGDAAPDLVFLPLHEYETRAADIAALKRAGLSLGVSLPRGARDKDFVQIAARLKLAVEAGAEAAWVANLGHLALCQQAGLPAYGDAWLNAFNSHTLESLRELGFAGVTASAELSFPQLRDLGRPLPVGMAVYGKLPLMLSENCLSRNEYGCTGRCRLPLPLTDRMGETMPVLRDGDSCRNLLHNAKTLYLADKKELRELELSFWVLTFTQESSAEAADIVAAYRGGPDARPEDFTRGLTSKGVL